MKKLLSMTIVLPFALSACGGASSSNKETTYGVNDEYFKVGESKFTKDTFYQLAKSAGWSKVQTWFNQQITKHVSDNMSVWSETNKTGYESDVKNALKEFDLFKSTAADTAAGKICEGVTTGDFCYKKAERIVAEEIVWEQFQQYKVQNSETLNYSYSLTIRKAGFSVDTTIAEPTDINHADFEKDSRAWIASSIDGYINSEIVPQAVERLFTMNYLLSLENQSTYVDAGNTVRRPTARLNSAFTDNLPAIWTVYRFEYDKVAQARAAINGVLTSAADGDGDIDTTKDTDLKALAGYHGQFSGIGHKGKVFGAPTDVTNIANSSDKKYRKTGFVNTAIEIDDFDFISKPNADDDFYYLYHVEPIELKVDSSNNDSLVKQDPHTTNAPTLKESDRLYAYFGLGSVSTLNTYTKDHYYNEFKLEAFDQTIYDFLSSSLDN